MLNGKTVGVVVSAYNEETQIEEVLKSIPAFVDRILVVNDASKDRTNDVVRAYVQTTSNASPVRLRSLRETFVSTRYNRADQLSLEAFDQEMKRLPPHRIVHGSLATDRIVLAEHVVNAGKGATVATGYALCRDYALDCIVTIDGDGQMDPGEMENICRPIVFDDVDFVKGNRLSHRAARVAIPFVRYFGNSVLSILTKIASGYWTVSDTQTGYTAISRRGVEGINVDRIYRRYGMPNDILVRMNIFGATIREIDIKPVYGVGEQSKMKIGKVIPRISWLLAKCFVRRLWQKYFIRSFHPLFLLYHFAFLLLLASVPLVFLVLQSLYWYDVRPPLGYYFATALCLTLGFQSLLFAMWMDIEDNHRLVR